jgi:hypothetical protein
MNYANATRSTTTKHRPTGHLLKQGPATGPCLVFCASTGLARRSGWLTYGWARTFQQEDGSRSQDLPCLLAHSLETARPNGLRRSKRRAIAARAGIATGERAKRRSHGRQALSVQRRLPALSSPVLTMPFVPRQGLIARGKPQGGLLGWLAGPTYHWVNPPSPDSHTSRHYMDQHSTRVAITSRPSVGVNPRQL